MSFITLALEKVSLKDSHTYTHRAERNKKHFSRFIAKEK